MAKNLEIKLKIENHRQMVEKALQIGADFVKELHQKDVYYEYHNGILKLRLQDGEAELIKYNRNENNDERWSEYYVLKLSDKQSESFFSKVFKEEIRVEKVRSLFIYKNTRIHIDSVKNLGSFIELETVFKGDENESKAEFDEVKFRLGLNENLQIRKSYRDLMKNDIN